MQMTGEKVKNKTMLIRAVTALLSRSAGVTAAAAAGRLRAGGDSGGPRSP